MSQCWKVPWDLLFWSHLLKMETPLENFWIRRCTAYTIIFAYRQFIKPQYLNSLVLILNPECRSYMFFRILITCWMNSEMTWKFSREWHKVNINPACFFYVWSFFLAPPASLSQKPKSFLTYPQHVLRDLIKRWWHKGALI